MFLVSDNIFAVKQRKLLKEIKCPCHSHLDLSVLCSTTLKKEKEEKKKKRLIFIQNFEVFSEKK